MTDPAYGPTSSRAALAALRCRDDVDARAEGRFVLGHHDIRVEHVRFDGDPPTRVVALYDVDSLCRERETLLVGTIAMMFCANWQERRHQAPTVEQMKTFVAEYGRAREAPFSRREREEIAAAIRGYQILPR